MRTANEKLIFNELGPYVMEFIGLMSFRAIGYECVERLDSVFCGILNRTLKIKIAV